MAPNSILYMYSVQMPKYSGLVRAEDDVADRDLTLRVDLASDLPVYRQIVNGLRAHLVAGGLAPGTLLPSVRELALDLGVHHNTVAEAYRILAEEGWLDLRRRRGALVLDRHQPKPEPEAREGFRRRLGELVAEARSGGLESRTLAAELRRLADGLIGR